MLGLVDDYGAFHAGLFDFRWDFDGECGSVVGNFSESASEFATVFCEDFDVVAQVFEILLFDFEWRSKSGRANFEFVVFDVAVESGFDFTSYGSASVDVDARRVVDFDGDDVALSDVDVDNEYVGAFDGVGHGLTKKLLIDHFGMCINKRRKRDASSADMKL